MQKLALYNFFGVLRKAQWVSYIPLTEEREAEIQSNFSCTIDFWYPRSVNELDNLLEEFKQKARSENVISKNPSEKKNVFGENVECDRLIVLDDFSGLADDSKKFASFLTVERKYAYNCVYIFFFIKIVTHTMKTNKSK